jgi:hypothetical protein
LTELHELHLGELKSAEHDCIREHFRPSHLPPRGSPGAKIVKICKKYKVSWRFFSDCIYTGAFMGLNDHSWVGSMDVDLFYPNLSPRGSPVGLKWLKFTKNYKVAWRFFLTTYTGTFMVLNAHFGLVR